MPILGSITPAVPVRSVSAAIEFYRGKLGFTVRHRDAGGAFVVRDGAELHLTQLDDDSWRARPDFIDSPVKSGAESFLPGTASLRIRVDDVRSLYDEFAARGALHPRGLLREQPWGDIEFAVGDADRNLITFYQRSEAPLPSTR